MKNLVSNFKAMPLLLKILFIVAVWAIIGVVKDFIQLKPITYSYFNSGFPKNYPFVWYVFQLLIESAGIFVFLKRSYRWLKIYLITSLILTIPWLINQRFIISNFLPDQQRLLNIVVLSSYLFAILITIYLFKQKKYFNQP